MIRRDVIAAAIGLLALLGVPGPARGFELPRPNILFVIADDWGYGHAGAYGCEWVKTPSFDLSCWRVWQLPKII